ncbi:hypothetical protein HYALB_00003447 [Hymenoscyphus albidus]|uniref:LysM domain-containing protein n=1 Tax=Hymenoscyphus albidus TaxID=595503 RepID=A0A9N9LDH7_9HELO|nr:hypothetical protein HYALB_00003447 [Hymenoscyphus albidus]
MISSSSRSSTANPRSDSPHMNSNSSIRPRKQRPSLLDDQQQELTSASGSRASSREGRRGASPIPQKHPSRKSVLAERERDGQTVRGYLAPGGNKNGWGSLSAGNSRSASPAAGGGLWNTGWMTSALQQVATSVLGSMSPEEEAAGHGYGGAKGKVRRRAGSGATKRATLDQWGVEPDAGNNLQEREIGIGSTQEREAAVRAKKTQRILEGRDDDSKILDTNGNYKRRSSSDGQRPSTVQDEGDALVYIHHVQKQDTLAGVVLRYNCPKEVFKKANGLWSEAGLPFRKTVVLPVDACAIKGRPCDPPEVDPPYQGIDLLAPTTGMEEHPFTNSDTWPPTSASLEMSAERSEDDKKPWTHVRWVLIDSSPNSKPVEIGRMSQKTLGYFPPRRRKSLHTSAVSTPRGSLDLNRLSLLSQSPHDPSLSSASSPSRRTSNLGPQTSQPLNSIASYFTASQPTTAHGHRRRESVGEAANRLGWMRGPGGVGTLGKNVRRPGPSNDGLNTWANKHIPGLAIDDLPSTSLMGAETAQFGFSDELAAIAEGPIHGTASETTTPGNMGLENAAAAVEGFFRKLVVKGPGTPRLGPRRESDLIELLDGASSDDGRGFEISPGRVRSSTPLGSGREDLEGVLRGRSSAGTKGGKGD